MNKAPPHLVSLSAVTWGFPLVGRTRMLTEAWLATGVKTTFVQAPSYRTAFERLTGRGEDHPAVVRPWPAWPSVTWTRMSERRLRRAISARARALKEELDASVDWPNAVASVISPVWTPWLDELPFGRVVYDCIDDLDVHVPRPVLGPLYRRWEHELVSRADAAVVTAAALGDSLRARRGGLPIALIRNGVDVDTFARRAAEDRPYDVPGDRPVVGFVGALYHWMNWDLVEAAAKSMPGVCFALVGPWDDNAPIDRMRRLSNVLMLGRRPYRDVPRYIAAFDACWVPFDASRVSALANPVKIYEYLALGKPVVSTPVADTESFQNLVRVARDEQEMVAQLRGALDEDRTAHAAAAREAFARANSWGVRAAEYVHFARALIGRNEDTSPAGVVETKPRAGARRA